jgi:D-glycero-alpha-D-manno-heptose 1-phosphate guanylyltransferase
VQRLSEITAVILAGGLGTRLRPAVSDKPKVLAEIHGRGFLIFILDQLVAAGTRRVVLCTGYMSEEVRNVLGESYGPLKVIYSREEIPLGTGGALRLALPKLTSDAVLVMNGDSYINADLGDFLRWSVEKAASAALILTRVADTERYGRVVSGLDGGIVLFEEKAENRGPGWINAGLYLLRTELIGNIPSGRVYSLEREFFPGLIGKGLYGYQCNGEFIDIGTPDSYRRAEAFFLKIRKRG